MTQKDLFWWYLNKHVMEWWYALPESERKPFHKETWHELHDEAKWTLRGLWLDSVMIVDGEVS